MLWFIHWRSFWNLYRLQGLPCFFNAVNILVGNLPAEVASLAALFHMLFQEDRTPGIRRKRAGRRQQRITHAILHSDFTAQKLSERRHAVESAGGFQKGQ